jgi:uncharacterized SAM-binding protein YcdF (DUF218 family)
MKIDPDAELVFAYLAATDPRPAAPVDAIVGFGTFDLGLARFCGDLQFRGFGPLIIFTGGIGAGTADLGQPEADAWRAELRRSHPAITDEQVILENRSTNTAENIGFTAELLARLHPGRALGLGVRTVIGVASPSRLRRVALTWRKLQPAVPLLRQRPPTATYTTERALYETKGFDYDAHLCGELDRIVDYSERGWIATEMLPEEILVARARLKTAAGGRAGR